MRNPSLWGTQRPPVPHRGLIAQNGSATRRKVLVADDDPGIIDALSILLDDEGYEVATITHGDIVRVVQDELPDLVLLDIRLSGLDGAAVCREMKALPATADIPVIVFSANRDGAAIARDAGADDFLAKPFEITDLLDIVAIHARGEHHPA